MIKRLLVLFMTLILSSVIGTGSARSEEAGTDGEGIYLDGKTYVDCGSSAVLDTSDTFTIEGWIKPAKQHMKAVASKFDSAKKAGYALYMYNTEQLKFIINNGEAGKNAFWTGKGLVENRDNHFAVTFDRGEVKAYINGVLKGAGKLSDPAVLKNDKPLFIGRDHTGNNFSGGINELRVYNRVLSIEEIAADNNSRKEIKNPGGLVLRLDFGKTTQNGIYKDTSGSGNDGRAFMSAMNSNEDKAIATAVNSNGDKAIVPAAALSLSFAAGEKGAAWAAGRKDADIHGAAWVEDEGKPALHFNGQDGQVEVRTVDLPGGGTSSAAFTVEAWVKPEGYFNAHAGMTLGSRDNGSRQTIAALADANGRSLWSFDMLRGELGFAVFDQTGKENKEIFAVRPTQHVGGLVPINFWNHVAVCYTGKEISIYVNGNKRKTMPFVIKDLPAKGMLMIGGRQGRPETTFLGLMREVRISGEAVGFTPEKLGIQPATIRQSGAAVKAEVKPYNGAPALFINGAPTPALICREQTAFEDKTDYLRQFSQNGVKIFVYGLGTSAFHPAQAKYATLEEYFDKYDVGKYQGPKLDKVLQDCPDAYIMLQFMTNTTARDRPDWCKAHPEEMAQWPLMSLEGSADSAALKTGDRPSIYSELWRQETVRCLTELVKYLRQSRFRDRIIGCFLCGPPSEWGDYFDYSQPAQRAFRRWVKEKYHGDIAALRAAWNDPSADFETLTMPLIDKMYTADVGIFYDPRKSQKTIDFLDCYHDGAREAISFYAKAIKEASGNNWVVGAWGFAHYYPGWELSPTEGLQVSRKTEHMDKLSKDPNIDFMFLCHSYRERHAGGVYCPQFMPESIIFNGKLAINEDDSRTCLDTTTDVYTTPQAQGDNFGQAESLEETVTVLKRNFAGVATKPGGGVAWYDQSGCPHIVYNHPALFKAIKTVSDISRDLLGKDTDNAQIAVIFSQKALYHQKFNLLREDFVYRLAVEGLARLGAPYDAYFDFDLENPAFPFSRYKLYIFADTFILSEKTRKIIAEKIAASHNTVLWIYAAGLIDGQTLSAENISRLTGMRINLSPMEWGKGMEVTLCDYGDPLTKGLPTDIRYGTQKAVSPILWCEDETAKTLGVTLATAAPFYAFRKPGLCMKRFDTWTSIWSAAPNPPSALLRSIARQAGVNIYSDQDDQVFASDKMLSVHTRHAGERTIKLPKKCKVYDPFQKKYIAENVDEFKYNIPAATTELWILE